MDQAEQIALAGKEPGPGYAWLSLTITATNTSGSNETLAEQMFTLTVDSDVVIPDGDAITAATKIKSIKGFGEKLGTVIDAHTSATRLVVFKVPTQASKYTLNVTKTMTNKDAGAAPTDIATTALALTPTPIPSLYRVRAADIEQGGFTKPDAGVGNRWLVVQVAVTFTGANVAAVKEQQFKLNVDGVVLGVDSDAVKAAESLGRPKG